MGSASLDAGYASDGSRNSCSRGPGAAAGAGRQAQRSRRDRAARAWAPCAWLGVKANALTLDRPTHECFLSFKLEAILTKQQS